MSAQPQLINKVDRSPSERLWEMAASDMASVDQIILERMQSPVGLIPDLAKHLISAGGKRLRPLLTVATSLMCGYKGDKHHKLAAAVEFIHSATLLHDDVVDDSTLRRGKKPANLVWGNSPSILVGDFLFARAFNLMVETNSLEALKILSNAENGLFNVISIEFPIIFTPETPPSSGAPDCVDSKYSVAPTTLSWNSSYSLLSGYDSHNLSKQYLKSSTVTFLPLPPSKQASS